MKVKLKELIRWQELKKTFKILKGDALREKIFERLEIERSWTFKNHKVSINNNVSFYQLPISWEMDEKDPGYTLKGDRAYYKDNFIGFVINGICYNRGTINFDKKFLTQ